MSLGKSTHKVFCALQNKLSCFQIPNNKKPNPFQLVTIVGKKISKLGSFAVKILEDFSCSKLFLGVDGIDMEFGLTTTNMMEAQLNKKMINAAQKTIVLADSSKFGKRGFGKICGLEDIDQVITDTDISEHMVEMLQGMGIQVTIV